MIADLRATKSMLKKIRAMGTEDTAMMLGDGKLHERCVDPAHVAMLDMTMELENCDMKPVKIALNFERLFSRINLLPFGNINKQEDMENKLKIDMTMNGNEPSSLIFHHPMLNFTQVLISSEGIPDANIPSGCLNVDATANINTRQFKLFLKIAEAETDHIALIADQKKGKLNASFSNDYDETISSDLTYSLGGIEGIDLKFSNKDVTIAKSLFSIDYMASIVNLVNAPTIKIGLKTDNPLVIWWKEKDNLEGVYFLAPRIESD